jgi:hypothetical protein
VGPSSNWQLAGVEIGLALGLTCAIRAKREPAYDVAEGMAKLQDAGQAVVAV